MITTETKFTPGPWKVFRASDGRFILGVGDKNAGGITDGGDVATNDLGIWRSGAERDANAALIAAAPELYEALAGLVAATKSSSGQPCNGDWEKAFAALAKSGAPA